MSPSGAQLADDLDYSPTKARDKAKPRIPIRFKTTLHGSVVWQVMLWRGWTEVEDDYDWDVFWCAPCTRCLDL